MKGTKEILMAKKNRRILTITSPNDRLSPLGRKTVRKSIEGGWLVQTEDYVDPKELFSSDYAYFSSTSRSWLMHAVKFCEEVQKRLNLNLNSLVIEIASNDGYLLRNFVANGIPCIGIEPTDSTAKVAESHGVNTIREFFCEELGKELASRGNLASLIVANNVFAHVPDINDFTLGLKAALRPEGTIVLEFPHLLKLIDQIQFHHLLKQYVL